MVYMLVLPASPNIQINARKLLSGKEQMWVSCGLTYRRCYFWPKKCISQEVC